MPDRLRWQLAAVLVLVVALSLPAARLLAGSDIDQVWVRNFPDVQAVRGDVQIREPIPASRFAPMRGLLVAPGTDGELASLEAAGEVDAGGFAQLTVSVSGQVTSELFRGGEVSVILVPDEPVVIDRLRRTGEAALAHRLTLGVDRAAGPYFAASRASLPVAFPRYLVYLTNGTDRTAELDVFLYLTQ